MTNLTQPQNLTLSQLAWIQLLVGAGFALAGGWLSDLQLGASIAFGAGLMLFNLIVLGWSWQRLIAKKSIAWTVGIIVIKYAVLLGSIVYLSRLEWFRPLGAGLGISSFVFAVLVLAVKSRMQKEKETVTETSL